MVDTPELIMMLEMILHDMIRSRDATEEALAWYPDLWKDNPRKEYGDEPRVCIPTQELRLAVGRLSNKILNLRHGV